MRVLLDGKMLNVCEGDPNFLVSEIEKYLSKEMLVLNEIKVDGVSTTLALQDVIRGSYQLVEIETKGLGDFIVDVLSTAEDYLPRLKTGLKVASLYFQNRQEEKGSVAFLDILEGLEWVNQLMDKRELLFGGKLASDREMDLKIGDYKGKLKELLTAWENKDYLLIGDLLEYELIPFVDYLINKFDEVMLLVRGEGKDVL